MDKTALITGASRGFGLALAKQLAEVGWNLIITARGEEVLRDVQAQLVQNTQVIAIAGDVSDVNHRAQLAQALVDSGRLDAVINNASILGPSPQPVLLDYSLDVLSHLYHVNVIAPLGVLQTVCDYLNDNPVIVNITSDAGIEAYKGWGGYGSSKAALEHLSAILSVENPNWHVYWADPGNIRTQMHQEAFPNEDISDRPLPQVSVPGLMQLLAGDLPSGRYRLQAMPERGTS